MDSMEVTVLVLSALRLGYAYMTSGSFGVELWMFAYWTSLIEFSNLVLMFFFVGWCLAVDWHLGMNWYQ
ncbi:hypothetical protein RhiirC2_778362 [Rhizophagus irregularis]|uniref:Uncharacterized protein n=1 Tax=Rhizophagus irregularis TaxID=588596 RepID=A0A2N1NCE1_9GLOM|nr:hypothetical protein RhiirC2_778362 [Rhizophagus irregularis]